MRGRVDEKRDRRRRPRRVRRRRSGCPKVGNTHEEVRSMTAEAPAQPATSMGPISYLVVEFPGNRMTGDGFVELMNLVDRGVIRVLDLAFVTKDVDGNVRSVELQDVDHDGTFDLAVFDGASAGLMDETDLNDAASAIEPGSSAGVLIVEN